MLGYKKKQCLHNKKLCVKQSTCSLPWNSICHWFDGSGWGLVLLPVVHREFSKAPACGFHREQPHNWIHRSVQSHDELHTPPKAIDAMIAAYLFWHDSVRHNKGIRFATTILRSQNQNAFHSSLDICHANVPKQCICLDFLFLLVCFVQCRHSIVHFQPRLSPDLHCTSPSKLSRQIMQPCTSSEA